VKIKAFTVNKASNQGLQLTSTKSQKEKLLGYRVLYKKAKIAYYEKNPIMSDAQFDKLELLIAKADPDWAELKKTGVSVQKKTKVALSHFMPSLNKFYPQDLRKKLLNVPYVVMSKLDGSALQLTVVNGKPTKLVTRGTGVVGGDISFHIKNLNLKLRGTDSGVFRCEAVMNEKVFLKKWYGKGEDEFDNSRNMVNGLLNRKQPHEAFKDIDIVVLGRYGHSIEWGLKSAIAMGLHTVDCKVLSPSEKDLPVLLEDFRAKSKYNMDGLVLAPSNWTMQYLSQDKPKDIWAFKLNDEVNAQVVEVKRIIWQLSSRGRLIPKIEIKPTQMDGVTVTFCTAHNAKRMKDHKIGPGAKVKVLRSGGVIPKIVGVVKPGKFQGPEQDYKIDGVHFVVNGTSLSDESKFTIATKRILKFLVTMGVEQIASKTIEKLISSYGPANSHIVKILLLWRKKELGKALVAAGMGANQSAKIVKEFDKVFGGTISMKKLMVASQIFGVGIGERKLEMLEKACISMAAFSNYKVSYDKIARVHGFAEKSADLLFAGHKKWCLFLNTLTAAPYNLVIDGSLPQRKALVGPLSGKKVSFTGYRDKEQEQRIAAAGGEVINFGASTNILLYKEGGKESSKVATAQSKGIQVSTFAKLKI